METFGQWLRRHRKALELEQKDVAAKAGVSISYVSTLERQQPHSLTGKKITPEREKIIRLAKAVGNENEALNFYRYAPDDGNALPDRRRRFFFAALELEQPP